MLLNKYQDQEERGKTMSANILAVICLLVVLLAGGYSVWNEIGPDKKDKDKNDKEDQ